MRTHSLALRSDTRYQLDAVKGEMQILRQADTDSIPAHRGLFYAVLSRMLCNILRCPMDVSSIVVYVCNRRSDFEMSRAYQKPHEGYFHYDNIPSDHFRAISCT